MTQDSPLPSPSAPPPLEPALTLALADSRARYKDFVELSGDAAWETDHAGRFSFVSPSGLLGWMAEEMVGKRPHELGFVTVDALATPFLAQNPVAQAHIWLTDRAGQQRFLLMSALPRFDAAGAWVGARGICRDLSELREAELALSKARTRERLVNHIVHILRDGLSVEREFDAAARALTHALSAEGCAVLRRRGASWEMVTQYGSEPPPALLTLADAVLERDGALVLTGASRQWLVGRCQHNLVVNGAVAAWRTTPEWVSDDGDVLAAVADQLGIVWAQLASQENLQDRAERDGLTKLYNLRAFSDRVQGRLERGATGVLINIDLDNFKLVNDTLGHQTGDRVLRDVAALLEKHLRAGDIAGRVGGDEFLLWLERIDGAGAQSVAGRIIAGVEHIASGLPVLPKPLGASIGLAPVQSGDTLTVLMKRADDMMYHAKHGGKGRAALAPFLPPPLAGEV